MESNIGKQITEFHNSINSQKLYQIHDYYLLNNNVLSFLPENLVSAYGDTVKLIQTYINRYVESYKKQLQVLQQNTDQKAVEHLIQEHKKKDNQETQQSIQNYLERRQLITFEYENSNVTLLYSVLQLKYLAIMQHLIEQEKKL